MGSKSGGTENVTENSSPPPQVLAEYQDVMNMANAQAAQPLQQYSGNLVAGFTGDETSAMQTIDNSQGIANPYINSAAQLTAQGATPISAGTVAGGTSVGANTAEEQANVLGATQAYMNPYTQNVVNTTEQQYANTNAQQQADIQGNAISAGAWGGDRSAVAQAITAGQQQTAEAPVIAGLEQSGYTSALGQATSQYTTGLGEANTEQQANIGAQEASGWLGENAGSEMGALGNEAESTTLEGAEAQLQSGELQQSLNQEELDVPYEEFEQEQAYPYQDISWLSSMATGLGSNEGGTGTTTEPAPSTTGEDIGLGIAGLGLASSTGLLSSLGTFLGIKRGGRVQPRLHRDAGGLAGNGSYPGNMAALGASLMPSSADLSGTGGTISVPGVPDVSVSVVPNQNSIGPSKGPGPPQAPKVPNQQQNGQLSPSELTSIMKAGFGATPNNQNASAYTEWNNPANATGAAGVYSEWGDTGGDDGFAAGGGLSHARWNVGSRAFKVPRENMVSLGAHPGFAGGGHTPASDDTATDNAIRISAEGISPSGDSSYPYPGSQYVNPLHAMDISANLRRELKGAGLSGFRRGGHLASGGSSSSGSVSSQNGPTAPTAPTAPTWATATATPQSAQAAEAQAQAQGAARGGRAGFATGGVSIPMLGAAGTVSTTTGANGVSVPQLGAATGNHTLNTASLNDFAPGPVSGSPSNTVSYPAITGNDPAVSSPSSGSGGVSGNGLTGMTLPNSNILSTQNAQAVGQAIQNAGQSIVGWSRGGRLPRAVGGAQPIPQLSSAPTAGQATAAQQNPASAAAAQPQNQNPVVGASLGTNPSTPFNVPGFGVSPASSLSQGQETQGAQPGMQPQTSAPWRNAGGRVHLASGGTGTLAGTTTTKSGVSVPVLNVTTGPAAPLNTASQNDFAPGPVSNAPVTSISYPSLSGESGAPVVSGVHTLGSTGTIGTGSPAGSASTSVAPGVTQAMLSAIASGTPIGQIPGASSLPTSSLLALQGYASQTNPGVYGSSFSKGGEIEESMGGGVMPATEGLGFAHGGRLRRVSGGSTNQALGAASGFSPGAFGGNPLTSNVYQTYSQLPPEKLQELTTMLGSNSPYGQLAQRALATKQMTGQTGNQPATTGPTGAAAPSATATQARGGRLYRDDGGSTDTDSNPAPTGMSANPYAITNESINNPDLWGILGGFFSPAPAPADNSGANSPVPGGTAYGQSANPHAPGNEAGNDPYAGLAPGAQASPPGVTGGQIPPTFNAGSQPSTTAGLGAPSAGAVARTEPPPSNANWARNLPASVSDYPNGGSGTSANQAAVDRYLNSPLPSPESYNAPQVQNTSGKWSSSDLNNFLIATGLGMMASPSHYPLQQLGEGGLQGLRAVQQGRQQTQAQQKEAATEAYQKAEVDNRAKSLLDDAEQHRADLAEKSQHDQDEYELGLEGRQLEASKTATMPVWTAGGEGGVYRYPQYGPGAGQVLTGITPMSRYANSSNPQYRNKLTAAQIETEAQQYATRMAPGGGSQDPAQVATQRQRLYEAKKQELERQNQGGAQPYKYSATGPNGQKIYSTDGNNWVDSSGNPYPGQ